MIVQGLNRPLACYFWLMIRSLNVCFDLRVHLVSSVGTYRDHCAQGCYFPVSQSRSVLGWKSSLGYAESKSKGKQITVAEGKIESTFFYFKDFLLFTLPKFRIKQSKALSTVPPTLRVTTEFFPQCGKNSL